ATQCQRDHVVAEDFVVGFFNDAYGIQQVERVDGYIADIGDVAINTFNLLDAVRIIEEAYDEILGHDVIPLTLGG
ncbi:hypothetical protein QCD79_32075, partial [Pseudomonas quasicaspiana]|nr:hypothetical protein [Pseudomonas quasicaspiana]